jgi:protein involved in polysaccharide export with SLBB domain
MMAFAKQLPTVLSLGLVAAIFVGCRSAPEPVFTSKPDFGHVAEARSPTRGERLVAHDDTIFCPGGCYADDLLILVSPDTGETNEIRMQKDGTITVPSLGTFAARGKTLGELFREIASKDPRYRRDMVRLNLPDYYYVTGAVNAPGPKPCTNGLTVTKAIEAAGGLTGVASTRRMKLTPREGTPIIVNYDTAFADPKLDPKVFSGDLIHVSRSPWR